VWLAAVVALALLWLQVLRLEHAQRRAAQAAHTARAAVAFAIDLAAARLACHLDPDPQSPQIQPPTPWADARVSLHIDDHSLRHDPTDPASAVPVVPGGHTLKTTITGHPSFQAHAQLWVSGISRVSGISSGCVWA
jgi:type II secretory pathway component PulK